MAKDRNTADLPEAFLDRMKALLGVEYEAFLGSYGSGRAQGLRINPLKGDANRLRGRLEARFDLLPVPWCWEGYFYGEDMRPGRHPYHEAGLYYIQEPSAMAVAELLDPRPGERILDLCAAPGGKTTQIAGRMVGEGLLVSNEIHPARAKILSQNVERMGIANAVVTNEEPGRLTRFFPCFFDRIVVDAPCSGEGMFRKDEAARAEWSQENVKLCAQRQREILANAAQMLKAGGRLVYSTCTFAPEEDEQQIAHFLSEHLEFEIETVEGRRGLSPGRAEWGGGLPSLSATFRIWPHLTSGEGHYLAVLRKKDKAEEFARRCQSPAYYRDKNGIRQYLDFAAGALNGAGETKNLILFGDNLYRMPEEMPDISGLKVLRPGLHLGTFKKNRLEPSHALALSMKRDRALRSADFDPEGDEIRGYLSGNTVSGYSGENGWVLVCAGGYSLGWGKAASGIMKNHYPKGLRIPFS